jgi:hypothetical protein
LEQAAGEVPVEEFHAAADRIGLMQLVELPREGGQVQLEHPRLFGARGNEPLFERQKIFGAYGLQIQSLAVEAHVDPAGHPRAEREVHPAAVQCRLLAPLD